MFSRQGKEVIALGTIVATRGASETIPMDDITTAINRHARGDWGEVCDHDRKENDEAALNGFRVLSSFKTKDGIVFWVITEADRSVTTVLLPDEY